MLREVATLYESDAISVLYRAGAPEFVVVTFSPSNWYAAEGVFWGLPLAERADIAMIGVVAKRAHWFPPAEMEKALPAIRAAARGYPELLTYGSSMGGYAALRYSADVGATCCLSFVPQVSICPEDVGSFDKRFLPEYVPIHHDDMAIVEDQICRNAFVFFDPDYKVDKDHVDLLSAIAPRIKRVPVRRTGHATIEMFAGTERTVKLFDLGRSASAPQMMAHAKALRDGSPVSQRQLITRILERRGPSPGFRAFQKYRSAFSDREAAIFLNTAARIYLGRNEPDEAERVIRDAMKLSPADANLMIRMTVIMERKNEAAEAIDWARRTIALSPNEVKNHVLLIRLLRRIGRHAEAAQAVEAAMKIDPDNFELGAERNAVRV